jgi:general secretion pathway protein K
MVKRLKLALTRPLRKGERGIALLAVMMGIALMTLLVMDFTTSAALGYLSAANQANELRAYYLARSAVGVGLGLLAEDSRMKVASQTAAATTTPQGASDSLNDIWAAPFPPMGVDGGTVQLSIVDEARKLDLNQLVNPQNGQMNPDFAATLERLFTIVGVSPDLVPAIADWIDPDSNQLPGGAELDYYMRLIPPYAPRNGPMPTIGDLRLIKGVDEATFQRLRPFLTTAPELQVNINTASPQVIASLSPQLYEDTSIVQQIIVARTLRPFSKTTDLQTEVPAVGTFFTTLSRVLTTRSVYFTIAGMGTFAGSRKLVYAQFKRQTNGTAMLVSWRDE